MKKNVVPVIAGIQTIAKQHQIGNIGEHSTRILTTEQLPTVIRGIAEKVEDAFRNGKGHETINQIAGIDDNCYLRINENMWRVTPAGKVTQTASKPAQAPRKPAVKQSGLDKYYESNWVSGLALEGAARALRAARIQNPTTRCVLMLMAENAHNDFGPYECALAQSVMAKILGVKQCTVSRAIKTLVDAKLIRPASSFVPGGKSICYELLFAIRGGEK